MKKLLLFSILFISNLLLFSQAPTNGLVAYYPFNGNANDESPSHLNNGTVNGATLITDRKGISNCAYNFDGSSSISAIVGSELSTTENTVSVWMAISGSGNSNPRIVGVGPSNTPGQNYALILDGTGNPRRLEYYSGQGGGINLFSTGTLSNGIEWKHITVTFKNNVAKFYINGVFDSQSTGTNGLATFSNSILQIGRSISGTDGFNGKLDDIRIYNRALSDTEVQALYLTEAPPIDITTGLVAHYKMDGNAQDASGYSNHGTSQNGVTFATDRFGIAGKAASFDGLDDWINCGTNFNFNSSFTISFFNNTTNFGNNPSMFTQGTPSGNHGLHVTLINQSSYRFGFFGNDLETSLNFPMKNTWNYWSFTYNSTTQSRKMFLNGKLIGSDISSPYVGTGITALGKNIIQDVPNGYYNGKLDDVRIYNRALSDTDIAGLYAQEANPNTGKPIVYDLIVPSQVQQGGILNMQLKAKANN
jgi:hypothetical protein